MRQTPPLAHPVGAPVERGRMTLEIGLLVLVAVFLWLTWLAVLFLVFRVRDITRDDLRILHRRSADILITVHAIVDHLDRQRAVLEHLQAQAKRREQELAVLSGRRTGATSVPETPLPLTQWEHLLEEDS